MNWKDLNPIHDRLQKYYDDTPYHMPNKLALPKWHLFLEWCKEHGYTDEDINRAKMQKYYDDTPIEEVFR